MRPNQAFPRAPHLGILARRPLLAPDSTLSDPLITRVQPRRPRGLKVLIHLDDGSEPFEVMLEALERSRLGVGDLLPRAKRHLLLNDDADIRVRDAALNLISYRARTRAELRRRLWQKGFRPARIDPCLDWLEERGFIDDQAVAAAFVRDRLRHRPRGKTALSSELRTKGVDGDLASRTIEEVFEAEETSDVDLAREVGEKWVARQPAGLLDALASEDRSPEKDKARRRLIGYLKRRGFGGEALGAGQAQAIEAARSRS